MKIIEALDKLNWALNRIEFLENLFSVVDAEQFSFTEYGLCGLCQNLREVGGLINDASNIITENKKSLKEV